MQDYILTYPIPWLLKSLNLKREPLVTVDSQQWGPEFLHGSTSPLDDSGVNKTNQQHHKTDQQTPPSPPPHKYIPEGQ